MPYVITTKTQTTTPGVGAHRVRHETRRHAVATLEKARLYTYEQRLNDDDHHWPWNPDPEGSSYGPLRDRTVITVERVSWDDLVGPMGWNASSQEDEVIDAYNLGQT